MPELPEVETVRLQLLRKVVGKTIAAVNVHHEKTINHDSSFVERLTGTTIDHIDRVGKLMIFSFRDISDFSMLAHLKMTGQFFFVDESDSVSGGGHSLTPALSRILPSKHTRVTFTFTDGTTLYFNDMRLFGYTKLASSAEVEKAKASYGQEPIASDFDLSTFTAGLKRRKRAIKAVLLDQTFIAGLGNIYVDEALWHAGVRPTRLANRVTKAEAERIAHFAGEVMRHSIKVGGTTFQHFADTGGDAGNYTDYLKVFGKQGTPCPRCSTPIIKIRCAGRGTHYCPTCQK